MEYREFPAPIAHAGWIHCLWQLCGSGGDVEPVVPDGRPELIIHLGEPYAQVSADGTRRVQSQVMVSGQLTRPVWLASTRQADIVGIRLPPAAGHLFPIAELTNQVVPLRDVNRRMADAVLDAAAHGSSVAERMTGIGRVLRNFARAEPDAVSQAVIGNVEGREFGWEKVASAIGMTSRTIQRRFRTAVGVPAKMYHRLVRFRRAFRALRSVGTLGFARVALQAGYYDQSHLIRDFQRFAGDSPRRFFQAEPDLAVALMSHSSNSPSGSHR